MIDKRFFEDLSQQISKLLPQAEAAGEDIKRTVAATMQKGFTKLDLLTREEFAAQFAALTRAEARIAQLEDALGKLEQRVQALEHDKA